MAKMKIPRASCDAPFTAVENGPMRQMQAWNPKIMLVR